MSLVVFLCGPAGSGKSTYARRLERAGMVRLSFDVELWRRGVSAAPAPADLAGRYFDHFEPPTPDEGPLTVVGP